MKLKTRNLAEVIAFLIGLACCMVVSPFPVAASFYAAALLALLMLPFPPKLKLGFVLSVCAALMAFSVVGSAKDRSWFSKEPIGHYAKLADNLRRGEFSLPYFPDPALSALADPYPPENRSGINYIWDLSYFDGKYYLYFGSAPAFSFALPIRLLTGFFPTELTQQLWFSVLALLFCALSTLNLLEDLQGRPASANQCGLSWLLLLFCLPFATLLRRPHIYEIAITSGLAYMMISLYLGERVYRAKQMTGVLKWQITGAGFAFGLAIASRPPLGIAGLILFVFLFFSKIPKKKEIFFLFVLGFMPVLDWIFYYNIVRFGNPIEFGFHYQLNAYNMIGWGFNFKDTVLGLSAFLFQWPMFKIEFPYHSWVPFGEGWLAYRHHYINNGVVGLFFVAPLTFLLIRDRKRLLQGCHRFLVWAMGISAFVLLFTASIAGVNVRYTVEVFPFLVMLGLIWGMLELEASSSVIKRASIFFCLIFSVQMGFFSSISIETDLMRDLKPEWIETITSALGDPEIGAKFRLTDAEKLSHAIQAIYWKSCELPARARDAWRNESHAP